MSLSKLADDLCFYRSMLPVRWLELLQWLCLHRSWFCRWFVVLFCHHVDIPFELCDMRQLADLCHMLLEVLSSNRWWKQSSGKTAQSRHTWKRLTRKVEVMVVDFYCVDDFLRWCWFSDSNGSQCCCIMQRFSYCNLLETWPVMIAENKTVKWKVGIVAIEVNLLVLK